MLPDSMNMVKIAERKAADPYDDRPDMPDVELCGSCEVWSVDMVSPCGTWLCEDCAQDHRGCADCATELAWEYVDQMRDRRCD
jgi:hypothetical protein